MNEDLKVFVGYDSREDIAYQVCKHSLEQNNKKKNIKIEPIALSQLQEDLIYTRDVDPLASTEFTFSRFLVPYLMEYKGWAVFCDCDFLWLDDIQKLFDKMDPRYAVMCVHHDYNPHGRVKMDGKQQTIYPRKNWSSLVLWNCGHPSNQQVTKELVNNPETTGQYMHRFSWLKDEEIGQLSHEWNWLTDWYKEPQDGKPRALHYTEGGPWFKDYERCDYAVDWLLAEKSYISHKRKGEKKDKKLGPFEGFKPELNEYIQKAINYSIDPKGLYLKNSSIEDLKECVKKMGDKVAAIDSSGPGGIDYATKGHEYDPLLVDFISGSGGILSSWDREKPTNNTLVIRGLGGGSQKALRNCKENDREFFAIDTGYFGNGKLKKIHRVTRNNLQELGPIKVRDLDRARAMGYKYRKFKKEGTKILICPPSIKVMKFFDQGTPEEWVEKTLKQIKVFTNRPIEIRMKPTRTDRVTINTIQDALEDDVFCLVTYNSIAALEALMVGKPAIALGPNAEQQICETELRNIDTPKIPSREEMDALMAYLAYCQFTQPEMRSGHAWRIINENSQLPEWHPGKE